MDIFSCCANECDKKFSDVLSFEKHMKLLHNIKHVGKFKCSVIDCGKIFSTLKDLTNHYVRFHKFTKNKSNQNDVQNNNYHFRNDMHEIQIGEVQRFSDFSGQTCEDEQGSEDGQASETDEKESEIDAVLLNFLISLHSHSLLSKDIINKIFNKIKEDIVDKLLNIVRIDDNMRGQIDSAFEKLNTQYKFEKKLTEKGFLSGGTDDVISYKVANLYKKGTSVIGEVKEKVCLMPIKTILEKIFTLPDFFTNIVENIQSMEMCNETINMVNCKRWKSIKSNYNAEDTVIPIDLYTDDFETGNALGSNAGTHKITAFYMSLPTLPQYLLSSPEYIFEILLYPSRLKHEGVEYCVETLIKTLKELEHDGIEILVNGTHQKVFFVVSRIIGDNLALNEILGYTTSFNAHKFCRICNLDKEQIKRNCLPTTSDIRTINEYDSDLLKKDVSKTGIKQNCPFNDLTNFHCVENIVCDIMHDLFEGVVKYDVAKILKIFIEDKHIKELTLDFINNIKQNFNYGTHEIGNLSCPISETNLKNNTLKMSASEVRTFLSFLPLMLGNYVEKENDYWKMLLLLVDISDLVFMSKFNQESINNLSLTIISYTEKYVQLFGNSLKPKHHFLLHYAQCIDYNGPLRYMMTFGYETKNKIVKSYAYATNQRINLAKSLLYKSAMRFNEFLCVHKEGFPKKTYHEKLIKINDLESKPYYSSIIHKISINSIKDIYRCKNIIHNRTKYSLENFIVNDQLNPQRLMKIFDILYINFDYFIVTELYKIEKYDDHLRSYKVLGKENKFDVINANSIDSIPFDLHKIPNGSTYFRIKYV